MLPIINLRAICQKYNFDFISKLFSLVIILSMLIPNMPASSSYGNIESGEIDDSANDHGTKRSLAITATRIHRLPMPQGRIIDNLENDPETVTTTITETLEATYPYTLTLAADKIEIEPSEIFTVEWNIDTGGLPIGEKELLFDFTEGLALLTETGCYTSTGITIVQPITGTVEITSNINITTTPIVSATPVFIPTPVDLLTPSITPTAAPLTASETLLTQDITSTSAITISLPTTSTIISPTIPFTPTQVINETCYYSTFAP